MRHIVQANSRSYRKSLAHTSYVIVIMFLISVMTSLSQANWNWYNIKPKITTEQEILDHFGKPSSVKMEFLFDGFEAWRNRTLDSVGYTFEYHFPKDYDDRLCAIGPLGESAECHITFMKRKVVVVAWTYVNGYRLHNKSGEGPTKITVEQIKNLVDGKPVVRDISDNYFPNAAIYRFEKNGFVLAISYYSEVSDIYAELSGPQ